jgi:hypothetical protein
MSLLPTHYTLPAEEAVEQILETMVTEVPVVEVVAVV